ncbi:MAG: hypothetical protein CVV51_08555 [Spirochaetae bacterium HGW-Spirochaetae-7]|nr:MAG: hypothetical protein CVV51_08555 [Spirochaetae bacterium HGW-Spirochaetae-7]
MVLVPLLILATGILAWAQVKDSSFTAEGANYFAEATGLGATEAEAQNKALRGAIDVIMESLGKDRLFSELFIKNPPVTMSWKKLSSKKGAAAWTVRLRLVVDDESLRLLYNASYVSTVSTILDESEARLSDAEQLGTDARRAESDGQLGRSMSLYWQARDACDSGLELLSPVGDAAVFSTFGKKKAPELREVLEAVRATAVSGFERIRNAERGLAEDEELSSALSSLAGLDDAVAEVEKWYAGIGSRAASIEGTPKAGLRAFGDELSARSRILSDSRLALGRIEDSVPKSKEIVRARIDVLRRRIDGTAEYLKKTSAAVGRELRDPAMSRAKRVQNMRWALLHEPAGTLAFRFYSPFGVDPEANDITFIDTNRFEFGIRAEGAFGREKGVWIATTLRKDDAVLSGVSGSDEVVKNTGYCQSIDLAFFGRGLFGAGIAWDWLRRVDGDSVDKRLAFRALAGGMQEGNERLGWLLALSWELPYEMYRFEASNVFNIGLDALLRLGTVVELNGGLAFRPRESIEDFDTSPRYDSSLMYSVGAGIRLPKPFLWGIEYAGHAAWSLEYDDGDDARSSYIRMFLEYSL